MTSMEEMTDLSRDEGGSGDSAVCPGSSGTIIAGGENREALTEGSKGPKETIPVIIKWSGKEYELEDVSILKNVKDLKAAIMSKTGVQPARQKLLNLTFKGRQAGDDTPLAYLNLKANQKIMMMGSLEKEIESVDIPPEERPDVNNDLDIPDEDDEPLENKEVHLNKVQRRIKEYNINVFHPPRPDKKLLVLDIDYTLFDHRSTAESGVELMRPYLHEFLTSAYKDYDIVIWSATSMKWVEEKMKLLGVSTHPMYKISFYLDYLAMISVHSQKYGVIEVKPLGVIWGKFPEYSPKNTIMIDDLRRNFIMNPQNGLRIRPFRSAHLNRSTDRELVRLSEYLRKIAKLDDLSSLNHRKWESYLARKHKDRESRRSHTPNSSQKM